MGAWRIPSSRRNAGGGARICRLLVSRPGRPDYRPDLLPYPFAPNEPVCSDELCARVVAAASRQAFTSDRCAHEMRGLAHDRRSKHVCHRRGEHASRPANGHHSGAAVVSHLALNHRCAGTHRGSSRVLSGDESQQESMRVRDHRLSVPRLLEMAVVVIVGPP